jgi:hypothetical protein
MSGSLHLHDLSWAFHSDCRTSALDACVSCAPVHEALRPHACRYDRAELRAAVSFYNRPGPLPEIQKRSWSSLGFFIPPPFAIAHHLISAWASR